MPRYDARELRCKFGTVPAAVILMSSSEAKGQGIMPLSVVLMGRLLRLGKVRIPAVEVLLRSARPRVRTGASAKWP